MQAQGQLGRRLNRFDNRGLYAWFTEIIFHPKKPLLLCGYSVLFWPDFLPFFGSQMRGPFYFWLN
jgi:hypothetical protein